MAEIYRGKRLFIEKTPVRFPDGRVMERLIVHPGNAVAILPIDGDCCVLVRQFRPAINETILEAPAGTMDEGETPEVTARRELAEETGLSARTLIPLGHILTTPGYTDERIYLFEARDLLPAQGYRMDDDEMIDVERVPLRSLPALIRDGAITDAKTICLAVLCRRMGDADG